MLVRIEQCGPVLAVAEIFTVHSDAAKGVPIP
jgi:hypothetical protein